MNKTLKRILFWGGSISIVVLITGYMILNYTVNRMLDSLGSEVLETKVNNLPEKSESSPTDMKKDTVIDDNDKSITSTKPKKDDGYSAEVTLEKAKQVKESVTVTEKLTVSTVLLKRLSPSDIEVLTSMAGGGMVLEEKNKAKKIILEKLSEEEYNELIVIAAKYGLSEGK